MKNSTKLYRNVETIMNDMAGVETEFRSNPTPRARQQLERVQDRLHILSDELSGMLKVI